MLNSEKYKTVKERTIAFDVYCRKICTNEDGYCNHAACAFSWLDMEAEEDKILPCPFCGSNSVFIVYDKSAPLSYSVGCHCGYSSERTPDKAVTIAAHNSVAYAVGAGQKEEK